MASPSEIDTLTARRESAIRYLYSRINYEQIPKLPYGERTFKLGRMRQLLDRLGNPQDRLQIVHIAGTKGKGSTATMVAAILQAADRRVGVFTSPHMDRIEERMAVDGAPCSADEFVDLVDTLIPIVAAMDRDGVPADAGPAGPTYFEITTAMALLHFARRRVDMAVLEVGLGGRLDSTNVCTPQVAVITSISLDHVQQLGGTLESIAREKAGIVKPGVPLISGVTDAEPRHVIRSICREQGSPLIELGADFQFEYHAPCALERESCLGAIDFRTTGPGGDKVLKDLSLALPGRHQGANAAVALAVIEELGRQGHTIGVDAIRQGLAAARCPGRVEIVARHPTVVIDAAHNAASVRALVDVLGESFGAQRRFLIFATTQEKDIDGMLKAILPHFDEVFFTRYRHNPRAVPPQELADRAAHLAGRSTRVCAKPDEAYDTVLTEATADDLICVTGSFFIAAEMRALVLAAE